MPAKEITRAHVFWALSSLGLALAPHVLRFSLWMTTCFVALAAWRVLGELRYLPLPSRQHVVLWWLKQILALGAFAAIYISFQGQLGRDAGVMLLTALLGLKLLELDGARDFYVVMFLAYFLVVTNFFYSQTLETAAFMVFVVVVITGGLVRFNTPDDKIDTRDCLRLAAGYVAQAIPLMAIGFFLFPRIAGPLWGVPAGSNTALTGLSNQMTIGHITELGVSDEIAFRVAFHGTPPRAQDLYWRGPVMWHSDGRSWHASHMGNGDAAPITASGVKHRYTVTIEPHNKRWIFGLDAVTSLGEGMHQTRDYRLLYKDRIKRRYRYTLESATQYSRLGISDAERQAALQLPLDAHPKARALADRWRAQHTDAEAIINAAMAHFNREPFVYTLTPLELRGDTVDEFLFNTRQGFCEHYAAAFVTLMRAAEIPARVVTGYQGGEYNTVSDYMVIRQRDAHAWAEVYLQERGWVRADPTAAVAPERVALGINRTLLSGNSLLPLLGEDSAALGAWRRFGNIWDAMNYNWSQWVLGYTPKRQRQLLDDAGLENWDHSTLMFVFTGAIAALTTLIGLILLRRRVRTVDPVTQAYTMFCRKLERIGLRRLPYEGPMTFAERVVDLRADLAADVMEISKTYTSVRYAGVPLAQTQLTRLIQAFNVST